MLNNLAKVLKIIRVQLELHSGGVILEAVCLASITSHQASTGSLLVTQTLRPHPDLLQQNLHFSKLRR